MPVEMYGESGQRCFRARRPAMQHIAVFESTQGIRWRLNHIHSMKYAEVISASIAANSAGIDYR